MSEGSRKSTPFDRILAKFIFHRAEDDGLEREATQGLITGHMLGTDTNQPLNALGEPVGGLIRSEARKVYKAANAIKAKTGQVDISAAGKAARIQNVAEHADSLVSEKIYESLPRVKARRVIERIEKDFIARNPKEYEEWKKTHGGA